MTDEQAIHILRQWALNTQALIDIDQFQEINGAITHLEDRLKEPEPEYKDSD